MIIVYPTINFSAPLIMAVSASAWFVSAPCVSDYQIKSVMPSAGRGPLGPVTTIYWKQSSGSSSAFLAPGVRINTATATAYNH